MQVELSPWREAQKRRRKTEAKDGKEILKTNSQKLVGKTTPADQIHKKLKITSDDYSNKVSYKAVK